MCICSFTCSKFSHAAFGQTSNANLLSLQLSYSKRLYEAPQDNSSPNSHRKNLVCTGRCHCIWSILTFLISWNIIFQYWTLLKIVTPLFTVCILHTVMLVSIAKGILLLMFVGTQSSLCCGVVPINDQNYSWGYGKKLWPLRAFALPMKLIRKECF